MPVAVPADPLPPAANGVQIVQKVVNAANGVIAPPMAGALSAVIAPGLSVTASARDPSAASMPLALVPRRVAAAIGPVSIVPALIVRALIAHGLMAPVAVGAAVAVSGAPAAPLGVPLCKTDVLIAARCAVIAIRPRPAGR